MVEKYTTQFASIDDYRKGGIQILNENPKRFVFSNIYEVAATSRPYERVVVAKNLDYTIEASRAEGFSDWYVCAHDEFAVAMDHDIEVQYLRLDDDSTVDEERDGAVKLSGDPKGKKMGSIFLKRGHQALLPEKTAYRFVSERPATLMLQTILGQESVEKWADICLA